MFMISQGLNALNCKIMCHCSNKKKSSAVPYNANEKYNNWKNSAYCACLYCITYTVYCIWPTLNTGSSLF